MDGNKITLKDVIKFIGGCGIVILGFLALDLAEGFVGWVLLGFVIFFIFWATGFFDRDK